MVRTRVLLLVALVAALALVIPATVLANHPPLNASEELVRDLLWDHASENNPWIAHSLSIDAVDRANEIRSEWQATGTISHSGAFDETTGCWEYLGEILAWNSVDPSYGYTYAAALAVNSWHNSPGHEAIMHGDWDYFGIGVVMIPGDYTHRFYAVEWGKLGPPCNFGD